MRRDATCCDAAASQASISKSSKPAVFSHSFYIRSRDVGNNIKFFSLCFRNRLEKCLWIVVCRCLCMYEDLVECA